MALLYLICLYYKHFSEILQQVRQFFTQLFLTKISKFQFLFKNNGILCYFANILEIIGLYSVII